MHTEKSGRLKKISREILEILRKISEIPHEVEAGVELEFIPSPVVKLYAKIRLFRELKKRRTNGNREEDNERRRDDAEGACKRGKA